MRRSRPYALLACSLVCSVLALLVGCAGNGADDSPAPTEGIAVEPPGFCDRVDDQVSELFCSDRARGITSLADLRRELDRRELDLDRTSMVGHSTALSGRLVSPRRASA